MVKRIAILVLLIFVFSIGTSAFAAGSPEVVVTDVTVQDDDASDVEDVDEAEDAAEAEDADEADDVDEADGDDQDLEDTAGVLPNSIFYRLERAIERLQLAISTTEERLAKLKADFALERAAEAAVMAEQGEDELAEAASEEVDKLLEESADSLQKAVELAESASETIEQFDGTYQKNSLIVLQRVYKKVPESAKKGIQRAIDNQTKKIDALNEYYAAKKVLFETKEALTEAQIQEAIENIKKAFEEVEKANDKIEQAEKELLEGVMEDAKADLDAEVTDETEANEKADKAEWKTEKMKDKYEEKAEKEKAKLDQKTEREQGKQKAFENKSNGNSKR